MPEQTRISQNPPFSSVSLTWRTEDPHCYLPKRILHPLLHSPSQSVASVNVDRGRVDKRSDGIAINLRLLRGQAALLAGCGFNLEVMD